MGVVVSLYYLSGPMSGYPDFNIPAFNDAAAKLRAKGLQVISPPEIDGSTDKTWDQYLRQDLKALLDCHHIVLMPGWQESRGAKLEHAVAVGLGMRVWRLGELLYGEALL